MTFTVQIIKMARYRHMEFQYLTASSFFSFSFCCIFGERGFEGGDANGSVVRTINVFFSSIAMRLLYVHKAMCSLQITVESLRETYFLKLF